MKKRLQGLIAGVLIGTMLTSGIALAANTTTLYNVVANGVKIVVDGKKLSPTDANGNKVEPMIYNGTTYLPVRAVANALGKAVYWDGPNYTVYLGNGAPLPHPTVMINDVTNIGDYFFDVELDKLTDNYGNTYASALGSWGDTTFQTLLNMKYSSFKATFYVPQGYNGDKSAKIVIKTDGKIIYSSPEISKTSAPVQVDLNIRGCNDFQIECIGMGYGLGFIGDAGFFQ